MIVSKLVLQSELYLSGQSFGVAQMARELGIKSSIVSATLVALREQSKLRYDGGRYERISRHWINRARLDDASGLVKACREATEAVRGGDNASADSGAAAGDAGESTGASSGDYCDACSGGV